MADTAVAITAGSGTNIDTRTEATNGNHRQVVVLGDPATNAGVAPVDATAGLKVDLGADNDITGSVTANAGTNLNTSLLALESGGNLAAIAASASVLDDWDETDRAKVNPIAGQAGVQGGSGSVNALTQRVVLATDVALPAGTNAIGKLSANSGVDIGDVDVTSVTPGTGTSALGKAEDAAASGGDTGVGILGVRNDTLKTTTNTDADYSAIATDKRGRVMVGGAPRELKGRQVTTITSSTSETTIVTAVTSTFLDLYGLILSNTSASGTEVTFRDATSGGTPSSIYVPAGETRGFMLPLDSAIPQASSNNNWTATCGTSVASLKVTALYVKNV